jgi:hypothetical protein
VSASNAIVCGDPLVAGYSVRAPVDELLLQAIPIEVPTYTRSPSVTIADAMSMSCWPESWIADQRIEPSVARSAKTSTS